MKKLLLLLVLLPQMLKINAQDSITIGNRIKLFSAQLQENRTLWVYLPAEYHNPKYAKTRYPVIYLLDGDANFHSYTGIVQSLAKGPYAMMPQSIVVGIQNTDRTRDLTPTAAGRAAYFDAKTQLFKGSGGNNNFIHFLEKELKPYIDSAYRTNGYNILNGHSFGGLTAVNILLNHTYLFNAYIIIDPSLWWDDYLMLHQADSLLGKKDFRQRNIFLALANKWVVPQDTTTDQPRSIRAFHDQLTKYQPHNLRWSFRYYENDDHGTVPIPAAFDGLKFIFEGHMVHVKQAVADPTVVTRQFAILSKQTGFSFHPTQAYLDWMANYCRSIGKEKEARMFEETGRQLASTN